MSDTRYVWRRLGLGWDERETYGAIPSQERTESQRGGNGGKGVLRRTDPTTTTKPSVVRRGGKRIADDKAVPARRRRPTTGRDPSSGQAPGAPFVNHVSSSRQRRGGTTNGEIGQGGFFREAVFRIRAAGGARAASRRRGKPFDERVGRSGKLSSMPIDPGFGGGAVRGRERSDTTRTFTGGRSRAPRRIESARGGAGGGERRSACGGRPPCRPGPRPISSTPSRLLRGGSGKESEPTSPPRPSALEEG